MKVSTLRPGLLVSLNTSIKGNVSYRTRDVEEDHLEETGSRRAVWETLRTIADPVEHEVAIKVRGRVRALITAHCAPSLFGLLCPLDRKAELDAAIIEARKLADAFNDEASVTRIGVHVIAGRIAADDVEAVRAINSEVRDLLSEMKRGLRDLDASAVRAAANKARALGAMLTPEAALKVQRAIDAARGAASRIVKAGEQAAIEIDATTLAMIQSSRTAFLDLSGEDTEIAEPSGASRAVDFDPSTAEIAARAMVAPTLETEETSNVM